MKLSFLPLPKRKIPAVIAMALSVISLAFFIAAAICFASETPPAPGEAGSPMSFNWWLLSMHLAMVGLIFYLVDAVLCVVRACQRRNMIFHIILAVVLVGSIPLFAFQVKLGDNMLAFVWGLYHLAMVVLEAVSIVKFT